VRLVGQDERWFIQAKRNANEHGVTERAVHELDDVSGWLQPGGRTQQTMKRCWVSDSWSASIVPLKRSPRFLSIGVTQEEARLCHMSKAATEEVQAHDFYQVKATGRVCPVARLTGGLAEPVLPTASASGVYRFTVYKRSSS
jgi:hypothetical protein